MNAESSEKFCNHALNLVNSGLTALALSLGKELGLVNLLCKVFEHPVTIKELADKGGLKERYVKEWLGCMVSANLVQIRVNGDTSLYEVPTEHRKHVIYAAEMSSAIGLFSRRQEKVKDCFRFSGPSGFGYSAFPETYTYMSNFHSLTLKDVCDKDLIPALGDFRQRLENGCKVLDIGCGSAYLLIHLAKRFSQSTCVGLDCSTEALSSARRFAEEAGAKNITFQEGDATQLLDSWTDRFDWILLYNVLHDLANPKRVLNEIERVLRKDGILSVIEVKINSKHQENKGKIEAAGLYVYSMYSCLPCSMSNEEYAGSNPGFGMDNMESLLGECRFEIKSKNIVTQEQDTVHYLCNLR